MKTPCLTAAAIALLSVILLPACEPGAQSNVVPGGRESSGADNSLEYDRAGQGATPDQVPGEPKPR
jgi:hypothetical protein